MTRLTEKLERTQCDCDGLAGKTIANFVRERGYYWLLFTDGTWACTDYQPSVSDMLGWFTENETGRNPFVRMKIVTPSEFSKHLQEANRDYEEHEREMRRLKYLQLKREFEPQS